MQHYSSEPERINRRSSAARRTRLRRPPADNRPSIGFALHNRFPQDEQPSLASFAQVMAHRIRGLLTGIEGYTDLLLESIESGEQRELAFRVLESTSRIEGILSDLQHYNSPIEAHFYKIPAASISGDVLSALADSEINRIKLDDILLDDIDLRADESLIRQALIAILRNALEADGPTSSPIQFSAYQSDDGESVIYAIRNAGSRLGPHEAQQIFQAFYTTKSNNLGLGLTLARRIAQIHKGDLTVTSNSESEYSEFTFRIPVYREKTAAG